MAEFPPISMRTETGLRVYNFKWEMGKPKFGAETLPSKRFGVKFAILVWRLTANEGDVALADRSLEIKG
jgi:hypothetical protein